MKRQADITRRTLLQSARDIVAEQGAISFTLEAVAKHAGVSKGALLHHFPTKKALMEVLVQDLVEGLMRRCQELQQDDPQPRGRAARGYLKAIAEQSVAPSKQFSALSVAMLSDVSLIQVWRESIAQSLLQDQMQGDDTDLAIVRLAADGMWSSALYGTYDLADARRQRILDRLIGMTEK